MTNNDAGIRLTFIVRLRAKPGINPIKSLRFALKVLGRRFGLQAISIREEFCDAECAPALSGNNGSEEAQHHD